jgi:pimeloyl-ACP methyl ester carboxylesterase
MINKSRIFAIHGAYSSPLIFNYLKDKLSENYEWDFFDYSDTTGGLNKLVKQVTEQTEPCHVVGHSMGGIIALLLMKKSWVKTVTTISTPLGGLDVNIVQTMLSRSDFIRDLMSRGDIVNQIAQLTSVKPVQHLISTRGFHPWLYEPNDGVVTVRSQKANLIGQVTEVSANHSEIMLSPETAELLQNFWETVDLSR